MGAARDRIWYVTIDDCDYFRAGHPGHAANLSNLQRIAQQVGARVEPIWMADLGDELLHAGTTLALFAAGSFPEWFLAASRPDWRARLDAYCQQIRATRVPVLAVCGSHQLVARSFTDWGAVGHMVPAGQPVLTVADELAQNAAQIPRPRLGEVGVFPLRACAGQGADPLLAGLPSRPHFVQYHRDQVIAGRHPGFQALLEPDPDRAPEFWLPDDADHANPASAGDRCQVQALRLNASERVLYTTQFHPELPAKRAGVDWQGERLILNFVDIARDFWA